jgi:hypothetical protein
MKWIKASDRLPDVEVPAKFGRLIGCLTITPTQVIWQDKGGRRDFHLSDKELFLIEWLDEAPELYIAQRPYKICVHDCTYCVNMAQDGFCEHVREAEKVTLEI